MVNSLAYKNFLHYDKEKQQFRIDYSREGFVYIFRAVGTNRIKIGISKDPERRLLNLASPQAPYKLEILYKYWFIDAYALEQNIHRLFCSYRKYGEWFEIPEDAEGYETNYRGTSVNSCTYYLNSYAPIFSDVPESSLIKVGLENLYDQCLIPIITDFLKELALGIGYDEPDYELLDSLSKDLLRDIENAIISPHLSNEIQHFFNKIRKTLLSDLNAVIYECFEVGYLDPRDTEVLGKHLYGKDLFIYLVGILSGRLFAYSVAYDTLNDLRLALSKLD